MIAAVEAYGGDTSLGVWFVLLLLLLYVSLPLHGFIVIASMIQIVKGNIRAYKWVCLYLVIALTGHIAYGAKLGAFEEVFRDIAQFKRSIDDPAQVKLERALGRGPSSNIVDVRDALGNGADPNAGILDGRIPFLVLAASRGDVEVVQALLDAGADPNIKASTEYGLGFGVAVDNPSPLDVVTFSPNKGMHESVELLLAAGADPAPSLMKLGACRRGDISQYDLAVRLKASGIVDAKDQTCLHHAAATNQAKFLQTLFNDPAYHREENIKSLGMTNHIGQFPLDVAFAKKGFEGALQILNAGGTTNQQWSLHRALGDRLHDPSLGALKVFLERE